MPNSDQTDDERIQRLVREINSLAHSRDDRTDYLQIDRLGRQLRDAHLVRGLKAAVACAKNWLFSW